MNEGDASRSQSGVQTDPATHFGMLRLDHLLRIDHVDAHAERLLETESASLIGTTIEELFGPLTGDLAPLRTARAGRRTTEFQCTVFTASPERKRLSAVFAPDTGDHSGQSTLVELRPPVATAPAPPAASDRTGRYSGPERRWMRTDAGFTTDEQPPTVADEIVNAIQRFGSRFDFQAMSALRVIGGQLHRSQLWNPNDATAQVAGPPPPVAIPPAVERVLKREASGPQNLGQLDPEIVTRLLGIPAHAQHNLSMVAARLDLPHGQGLLLGALEDTGKNQSLNFSRTLRDLGWMVTQLMARLEADEALTVQLRLEDTLRTIASGFLSIAPGQLTAALRESLWRFGTAVGALRVTLWMQHSEDETLRLAAQYGSGDQLPIVPVDLPAEALASKLNNERDTVVLNGRDFADVPLHATRGGPALNPRSRVILVPLHEEARSLGYILAVVDRSVPWSAAQTSGLDSLASLLISFLDRIENEERFDRAFSEAAFAVTWRKPTGELIRCNGAFLDFIGQDSEYALLGSTFTDLMAPETEHIGEQAFPMSTKAPVEAAFRHGSGRVVWGRVTSFEVRQGSDIVVLSHIEDITSARHLRSELVFQATHDELTGLSNRRGLLRQLDELIDPTFNEQSAAVLLIDVDRFKVVNDSLGHAAGDKLLCILADRVKRSLRPSDIAARLGGDEFVVVLAGPIDAEVAEETADRLLTELSGAFDLDGQEVYSSISLGIAFPHPADSSSGDVLRHADAAMYDAKRRGRNRYEVFDQNTRDALAVKSSQEAELRRALDDGDFVAYFQPEFDLRTREIVGAEALVRWPHPTRGVLTAGAIVPFAEEAGLIDQLGRLVLDQACAAAAKWSSHLGREHFMLRVNISASQLTNFEVVDVVNRALVANGLPASCLCLEVTETSLMSDPEQALEILDVLVEEVGVSIAVDDFGTGFSSLAYLRRLPVQGVKIDREFVLGLSDNPENASIIEAIVALAGSLGLEIVAEGIEDEETAQRLVELGVYRGQGFHLARPLDPHQAGSLILAGRNAVIDLA